MKELLAGLFTMARSPRRGWRLTVVRQFIKFSIVGVVNTLTSSAVYLLMTRPVGLDPLVGNAIAFAVAVTVSFTLNKLWTFRDRSPDYHRQYALFFVISGVGFVSSETIIFVLHKLLGLHDLAAFAAAVITVMFWNFSANRAWTFADRRVVAKRHES
ncbi:MAG: GtrA family protein [Candidatus Kerfeldbacteria bacterium]|nr:GtrA family protein [Candidatus Kerfeldbacteria bacterium]